MQERLLKAAQQFLKSAGLADVAAEPQMVERFMLEWRANEGLEHFTKRAGLEKGALVLDWLHKAIKSGAGDDPSKSWLGTPLGWLDQLKKNPDAYNAVNFAGTAGLAGAAASALAPDEFDEYGRPVSALGRAAKWGLGAGALGAGVGYFGGKHINDYVGGQLKAYNDSNYASLNADKLKRLQAHATKGVGLTPELVEKNPLTAITSQEQYDKSPLKGYTYFDPKTNKAWWNINDNE